MVETTKEGDSMKPWMAVLLTLLIVGVIVMVVRKQVGQS